MCSQPSSTGVKGWWLGLRLRLRLRLGLLLGLGLVVGVGAGLGRHATLSAPLSRRRCGIVCTAHARHVNCVRTAHARRVHCMRTARARRVHCMHRRMHELPLSRVGKRDWFKLFRAIDHKGNGRVCYGELAAGLREMLQLPEAELAEPRLQAMWKRLDGDESGFIGAGELIRFAKRGAAAVPGPPDSTWTKANLAVRTRVRADDELFKRTTARKSAEAKSAMEQEAERLEALLRRSQAAAAGSAGAGIGGSLSLPKIGGRGR